MLGLIDNHSSIPIPRSDSEETLHNANSPIECGGCQETKDLAVATAKTIGTTKIISSMMEAICMQGGKPRVRSRGQNCFY
jgi:hypothetical protein